MIEIEWDDRRITKALRDLEATAGDLTPVLKDIKETLVESTKQRFSTKIGPDDNKWAGNSDVTIENKGFDGPLVQYGTLLEQIGGEVLSRRALEVFSSLEYGAMMQFGGTKAEFPHLWGDIPARPFLGISFADDADIMSIIREHLQKPFD